MVGYWLRHRSLLTLLIFAVLGIVIGSIFVFPYLYENAEYNNSQSIYKYSKVDFIAPEPSFEQIKELEGNNGIDKVFPYYLTSSEVKERDNTRTTNVLMSDNLDNIDITMYNDKRIIEKSKNDVENPAYVDWQFAHETSAVIGDKLTFEIYGEVLTYTIYAIYEKNTVYDDGAILVPIGEKEKNKIDQNSKNNGYSGIYISASDYSTCKAYLETDYRPLGRLKDRSQFKNSKQYQTHYDAIMESDYTKEITDIRIKGDSIKKKDNNIFPIIGLILVVVIIAIYNMLLFNRGSEKVFFVKECIPKGKNVKNYYRVSFIIEFLLFACSFIATIIIKVHNSDIYIRLGWYKTLLGIIICVALISEIIVYIVNCILIKRNCKISSRNMTKNE